MKKHILFCIDTLNDGGAEKVLIEILRNIDAKRYIVDLLIIHDYGIYFNKIPKHINWYLLKDAGDKLSKKYDFEIAFLEGQATQFIASRNNNSYKIAWVHTDLYALHWSKSFYENEAQEEWCYSQMDKIIFVSKQVGISFNKIFTNIRTEQQVIYNLIDREKIRQLSNVYSLEKKKFTLCSIGRLVEQKGYHRLIPILYELYLEDYDFEFWIIGEGPQRQELEDIIKAYELKHVVRLLGFKENPFPYLKKADVFVQASYVEGFSLALCEAICLEKPILSTEVSGAYEILYKGMAGLIVKQDTLSIYKGIKRIIEDENYRKDLSYKASLRSEFFNIDNTMQQIYNLFNYANQYLNN
ncbi:glycosyl transferase [Bacteroidia bacterium]|nr:glycosyl transferase [Bacteroidia bacterium]GHV40994.1 glycosyl transferase [Bacteroidia bacterium]